MSVNFQPDICLPHDPAGFGQWLTGHYLEHIVLAQKCAALAAPVIVPDYDILSWGDEPVVVQQWLVSHQAIHDQISVGCNVSGIDFSLIDFSDDEQFFSWMDDHALEHQTFRSILGVF